MFTLKTNMEIRTVLSALNCKIKHFSCCPLKLTKSMRNSLVDYLEEQDRQAQQDKNRELWRAKERARTRATRTCKADNCPPCCCINGCKWIGS